MTIIVTLLWLLRKKRLSLSSHSCKGILALGDINCSNLMCPDLFALVFAKLRKMHRGFAFSQMWVLIGIIHWKYCEPFQAYLGIQTSSQSCQKKGLLYSNFWNTREPWGWVRCLKGPKC